MTVLSGTPQPPGQTGRRRGGWDPLQMTEAEKRACEREARHDVAARGSRLAPESLQHYLAHERIAHEHRDRSRVAAAGARSAARGAAVPPAAPPVAAGSPAPVPAPRRPGLLRRILGRRG
ncbi:hypothetical protein ACI792_16855 [Blastococcus sp. SYSU DS0669]